MKARELNFFFFAHIFSRSPYGPDGTENLAYLYVPFGYAIVMQNQRGSLSLL